MQLERRGCQRALLSALTWSAQHAGQDNATATAIAENLFSDPDIAGNIASALDTLRQSNVSVGGCTFRQPVLLFCGSLLQHRQL